MMQRERRARVRFTGLAGLVAAAVLVGASAAAPAGVAARQAQASPVPERIVSLVPAVTEMLFACGAGAGVVGVSSYDTYPAEALTRPKVGALIDPDLERILALKPDMVVVYGTQTDLITQLRRAGIGLFLYEHGGLEDIPKTIRRLGERIDHVAETVRLAMAVEKELALVRESVAGKPRPRTALIFGREPGALRGIFASGGVGFLHDLLGVAGGEDVFADVRRQSVQVSTETLLARAPAVIVEVHPSEGWTPERVSRAIELWRALPAIPAVRDGRVRILADDRLSIPGPRIGAAARLLAEAIHGQ